MVSAESVSLPDGEQTFRRDGLAVYCNPKPLSSLQCGVDLRRSHSASPLTDDHYVGELDRPQRRNDDLLPAYALQDAPRIRRRLGRQQPADHDGIIDYERH